MACSVNDLLKHTLKRGTFACPVKCNMVRQSKIKRFANNSSLYSLYLTSRSFHSCFLGHQFLAASWPPTNSLWSAQSSHQDRLSCGEVPASPLKIFYKFHDPLRSLSPCTCVTASSLTAFITLCLSYLTLPKSPLP